MNVNKSVLKIKQYNFQSVLVNMSRKRCVIFHSMDPNAVRYGPKNAEQFTQWKELAKGNTEWKGTNFKTFLVCEKHFSECQFERNHLNELLGLEKKRKLVIGAFAGQEANSTIKVILAVHYY